MAGSARIAESLDHTVEVAKRMAEMLLYTAAIFTLVTFMALVALGFYGIVHEGNDFGSDMGTSGGGDGDVIVVPRLLR